MDYLNKPISELYAYLKENSLLKPRNLDSLTCCRKDNLKLVIEKLIFADGHVMCVDRQNRLTGLLSIHDVIANFV